MPQIGTAYFCFATSAGNGLLQGWWNLWEFCGVYGMVAGWDGGYAFHMMRHCLRQACFFFAKRLFFRYGEGCEGRASRATVGVTAKDNGGACFPLDFGITPTKGRQPSHPHRSGFFCSFHATYAPTWVFVPQPPLSDGRVSTRCDSINSINS